jgi:hypothetical protein
MSLPLTSSLLRGGAVSAFVTYDKRLANYALELGFDIAAPGQDA